VKERLYHVHIVFLKIPNYFVAFFKLFVFQIYLIEFLLDVYFFSLLLMGFIVTI
jgi:hypothetical protein